MRIFGGHDYYDCGLSLGIDPSIVLVREKSKSVPVREAGGSPLIPYLELNPLSAGTIRNFAVVLCGKVYRGVEIGLQYYWSAEKFRAAINSRRGATVALRPGYWPGKREPDLDKWFEPFDTPEELRTFLIMNKYSILVESFPREGAGLYEERYFTVNRCGLKQIGFAKAVDPYTAFQELSMWIGGVLGGTSPETVTIKDDKVLIENHGFDKVSSFRGPRVA